MKRKWFLLLILPLLTMCQRTGALSPLATSMPPVGSVAHLLAQRPAPGTSIIINGWRSPGEEPPANFLTEANGCPARIAERVFTDTPLLMHYTVRLPRSNLPLKTMLTSSLPWLLVVAPKSLPVNRLQLRGHLDDAAYTHCSDAEHIFVIEEIVQVYPDEPLAPWASRGGDGVSGLWHMPPYPDITTWQSHHDPALDYTLLTPPNAVVIALQPTAKRLAGWQITRPDAPTQPILVEVLAGLPPPDPLLNAIAPIDPNIGSSVDDYPVTRYDRQSGEENGPNLGGGMLLEGDEQWTLPSPTERQSRVRFGVNDRTYQITVRFRVGSDLNQALLLDYAAMVDSLRVGPKLPPPPPPTPTPVPILLEQATAWARVYPHLPASLGDRRTLRVIEAELIAQKPLERIAEVAEQCLSDYAPDHLKWVFRVAPGGDLEDAWNIIIADGETGEFLCTTTISSHLYSTLKVLRDAR